MTAPARACPACHTPLPEQAHFCLHCGAATPTEPGVPGRTMATGAVEVAKVRNALADRYRIERVLGEGGMATVYLAEDVKHRRKVAVKVMRPELAATLGADRFLREIEIAAQLSHPHILPVHDSGETRGVLYYVMPYVEGESLRDRVQREGRLAMDEALQLAREVAEALGYAHKRGIIHRDIKPANIMLGEGHALVADFGIARATDGGQALTQTGLAVGTPQYMSPEQATGERDIDARADVYAIGAVLYEMLAGQPPYSGPTPQAILARSLTEEVQPLTAVRPEIPAPVAAVVARAMARRPADRYASGGELEQALASARDALRSGAVPVAGAGPSPTQAWGVFGLAAVVGLAVIYGLVSRWGLASWTLGLAGALLAIGAAVLFTTGRVEARRRAGAPVAGMTRWFTWGNAARGGGMAAALWVTVALALVFRGPGTAPAAGDGIHLAVLPFENRGDPADAYVVDGIADQVRGKLTGLGAFQVTARTSSDQYRGTTKSPQEIGRELGVDYLLTATVSWAKDATGGGRVQVVPELIDTRTGAVTWQQAFDAALTDVFQVQAEVAVRVAGALNVAVGAGERRDITAPPTKDLAAYDAYLKAEQANRSGGQTGLRLAINLYEQAVALDPEFAEAWAALSLVQGSLFFGNPTPEAAEGALRAAQRARALAPEAPESYAAMGFYYANVLFDFVKAREEFEAGLRRAPNHTRLLMGSAFTERALGRWDAAVELLRRAQSLDPRSVGVQTTLASNLLWLRRYGEALAAIDGARTLAPNSLSLIQSKAMAYLAQGDSTGARAVLRDTPPEIEPTRLVAFVAATWDMYWLLDDEQQRLLLRLSPGAFDDDRGAWGIALSSTYALRGDAARARAYGDSAAAWYAEKLRATPDDNYLLALSGVALAHAGRRAEAIRSAERSVALMPVTKDAFSGAYNQHLLATTYAVLGEHEKAIDQLEALLRVPYFLSAGWLQVDPTWDALRGNPRFERLMAG
jgi:eukaryotic-like serine/threonine-protein kinase